MTSVHSGFTFLCGECNLTMTRVDQRHGCERKALHRVKKETLTMTPEEAREFEKFQQERGKHVMPFMKELPLVFSDQPYQSKQQKRKRARLTEPHFMRKARKEAEPAPLPTQSLAPQELPQSQ
ncbi:hypothetical protein FSP39_022658 [Pinctada imbricata]|uniref:Uncharacterized protein n=1 Tax=Pinctada imbricata TaxID=66713 RepID=A0AA88Y825_PINIB|nr:hypothetical protein FSP39_022658 [Pinctada imbricata]